MSATPIGVSRASGAVPSGLFCQPHGTTNMEIDYICRFKRNLAMTNSLPYSTNMKMADLLSDNRMLSVLERLHFKLGFGESTIADVCRAQSFPTDLFVEISNVFANPEYEPNLDSLDRNDVVLLADYIRSAHKYYSEVSIPHLHGLIHTMLGEVGTSFADTLNKFFDELVEKLNAHFEHEEKIFNSMGGGRYEVESEESHIQFLEKLDDLKNIVIKYLPDNGNNASRYNMLNHLLAMEKDMRNHIRVEEKLFTPLVSMILSGEESGEDSCGDDSEVLSQREKEILAAVAHGETNKEIADDLFISVNTVVTHRKNIARKTGINSIAGLTVYAILNHIVEISDF